MDLAFVHLCILLSVRFLFSDMYCPEMKPFSQAVCYWFSRSVWTEEKGSQEVFPTV